jgi:hypothetical protein
MSTGRTFFLLFPASVFLWPISHGGPNLVNRLLSQIRRKINDAMQMCDTRILCAITTTSSLSFARAYLPIQISPFSYFSYFSYFWRNSRVKWQKEKENKKIK